MKIFAIRDDLSAVFQSRVPRPVTTRHSAHGFPVDMGLVSASGLSSAGGVYVLADMGGANLTGVNLSSANLTRVNGRQAILANLHLEGATLQRADFSWARLTGSYWRDASAVGVGLHRADLRGASFGYADLTRGDLSFAQVAAANFRHAKLGQASLEGTRSLHQAKWGSTVCPNGKLNPDTRPCRR